MAVQAGALSMTAPDDATRSTANTLRTLAAKTLTELREMVTILRDGDQASDISPQPRLADVPRLIRDSRTGATLRAHDILDLDWPAPTQRAAYRIVQEALTNVRKHATGAEVWVELTRDADGLRVLIRNGPPPRAGRLPGQLPGGGHGLIGLRERAELLGGSLTDGPTDEGGFELAGKLPGRPASGPPRIPSAVAAAPPG
jgi:signal transduction histidine kinase